MNTKSFGNIGEAMALSSFVKKGIPVYLPFGDNEKADLIAEFNGKLNRIQVKTSLYARDGKMVFDLTSSYSHRGRPAHKYSQEEVDYFFCYNIERNQSYLFPVPENPIASICIRYEEPKNNQIRHIKHEENYLFDHVIDAMINSADECELAA